MNDNTKWMSGNEAIALGAWEAGVTVASGYPGTPSTEIMENLAFYEGVYTEWAPNEKVGLEVAIGASFAGARALATMKHVGLNVAADPLFTASYTGGRGGLVIASTTVVGVGTSGSRTRDICCGERIANRRCSDSSSQAWSAPNAER